MPHADQLQAIMFADVSGSSALYKRLGNVDAKQVIDRAITVMMEETSRHSGTVVKTLGDEVMARFDTAEAACEAACAIQLVCQAEAERTGIALRIGLAYGPALLDETGDVFGDTVNEAAFVAHIARANQVLLGQSVRQALSCIQQSRCQEFDQVAIKGDTAKTVIYRLPWETATQSHSATMVMSLKEVSRQLESLHLHLTVAGRTIALLPDQTPFIIGRDAQKAHLHIDSHLASRDHCHIVFRRGKYVLVDHSTNGTYVCGTDQPAIYLRREELPLTGGGSIGIGQPTDQAREWLVHYQL